MRLFLIVTALTCLSVSAKPLWIVGENYLGVYDLGSGLKLALEVEPVSFGFDREACKVWLTDSGQNLNVYDSGLGAKVVASSTEQVISSQTDGYFFTVSQGSVYKRDASGSVMASWPRDWTQSVVQLLFAERIALQYLPKEDSLWLNHLDENLEVVHKTEIPSGKTVWQKPRVLSDKTAGDIWVGFSTKTATHVYSPIVELRKTSGEREKLFEWNERGLFLGFCLNGERELLVARDVPSDSGYTVPLYSYLDRVSPSKPVQRFYGADVNYLIDALTCSDTEVFLAERSIWSSEGSYLVRWDKTPEKAGVRLLKLPGKALELYDCR